MPIHFSGTITYVDYRQAMQLHQKTLSNPLGNAVLISAIALIITLGVGIVISPSRAIAVLVFFAVVVLLMVLLSKATASASEETWLNNAGMYATQTGIITEAGIESQSSTCMSQMKWSHCQYHAMTPHLILLYSTPYNFGIYPQSFFATLEGWVEFTQQVQLKVPTTIPTTWRRSAASQNAWVSFLLFMILTIGMAVVFSF